MHMEMHMEMEMLVQMHMQMHMQMPVKACFRPLLVLLLLRVGRPRARAEKIK